MRDSRPWLAAPVLALACLLVLGTALQLALPTISDENKDIYFMYVEGTRIREGSNPYLRILSGNMRENAKYPTYFPLFYLVAALMQSAGLSDYQAWLAALRWALLPFNIGAGALIFWILYRRRGLALALLGGLAWLLNRWNLRLWELGYIDCAAIFCLVLSLWLLERQRLAALLLLSISLALKHLGLFLVPLYLIAIWQHTADHRLRRVLIGGLVVASVPALTALPFLVWPGQGLVPNVAGFARSVFFSVTRDASRDIDAPSLDAIFNVSGVMARLPMLAMFGLVYVAFAQGQLRLFMASFFVMALLIGLNPVLFMQYLCWLVPLGFIAAADLPIGVPTLSRAPVPAPASPDARPRVFPPSRHPRSDR